MNNENQMTTDLYQVPEKKQRGRRGSVIEAAELRAMRAGIRAYVKQRLAAGFEVCPILLKYVPELVVAQQ